MATIAIKTRLPTDTNIGVKRVELLPLLPLLCDEVDLSDIVSNEFNSLNSVQHVSFAFGHCESAISLD